VSAKRARLYDAFALLTVIICILLDQWTKQLVVQKLTLGNEVPFPVFGHYLVFKYTQNSGAAFSMLKGNGLLALFIIIAIAVVGYFYSRIRNSGTLSYKLVFGLIIGGALGNLLDRLIHGGYVVDFVFFHIPEINFNFAIFNMADAAICIGVMLLFVLVLFSGLDHPNVATQGDETVQQQSIADQGDETVQQSIADQGDETVQQSIADQEPEPISIVNQKETS
jgi:signal peptidase II